MQTIYDSMARQNLLDRLNKLSAHSQPLWGKMNVSQMLHHLNRTMEAPLGKMPVTGKPNFMMRMFKGVLYNDKPFGKGSPTPKDFKVNDAYDFNQEQQKAVRNLEEVAKQGVNHRLKPHVFFGTLTSEQWGKHFYKHTDHHLRQFGK